MTAGGLSTEIIKNKNLSLHVIEPLKNKFRSVSIYSDEKVGVSSQADTSTQLPFLLVATTFSK